MKIKSFFWSLIVLSLIILTIVIIMFLTSFFKKPYISELVRTESEVHLYVGCKSKKCGHIFFTSQKVQILYSCGINFFKGSSSMDSVNIDYKKGNLEIIYICTNKILVSLKCEKHIYEEILKYKK